jgi:hypothetical protein
MLAKATSTFTSSFRIVGPAASGAYWIRTKTPSPIGPDHERQRGPAIPNQAPAGGHARVTS